MLIVSYFSSTQKINLYAVELYPQPKGSIIMFPFFLTLCKCTEGDFKVGRIQAENSDRPKSEIGGFFTRPTKPASY